MTTQEVTVDSYEDRLAAVEAEWRAKYNAEELKDAATKGHAMEGGSYPVKDEDDLKKAIKAVGRGNADHDAIRAHIIKNAKRLKLSSLIPDNWNSDGSLSEEQKAADLATETRGPNLANARAGGCVHQEHGTEDGSMCADCERSPSASPSRRRKERHRAVPLGRELRHFDVASLEVREATDTNEIKITGQPIVYGAPYLVRDVFGEFEERMHPGCASAILERGVDCRLLLNHEGLAMARTTAGTLALRDTPEALTFEATLDARQQLANDFAIAVERKDMTQMSVGMIVGRDTWGESGGRETRDVYGLDDLLDVSGVTYPCSPTTSLEIARRMALEMPIESRARVRRLAVDLRAGRVSAEELADVLAILQGDEERAGQVLSGANKGKLIDAAKSIHGLLEAAGYDPADLINGDAEASQETALAQDGTRSEDGEPIRSTMKASTLRLQMEARARRKRQKLAA